METLAAAETGRYILSEDFVLRGWKLLPYAIQNLWVPRTIFFRKREWDLVRKCDGNTDLSTEDLTENDRILLTRLLKDGYIRPSSGEQLHEYQKYRFFDARFKESAIWSITGRCNSKCRHCFMSASAGIQGEADYETMIRILDSLADCGIRFLDLTGGEPLIRSDFMNLVDAALERGMVIRSIGTNGLLVTDEFLDELALRNVHPYFMFSFDGTGYHDWMRGIPGSEKKVLEAMKLCKERGIAFTASMVLFKENKDSIRDTVRLLSAAGCKSLKIANAYPQGEWLKHKENYLSQADAFQAYLDYIPYFFEDGMPLTLNLEGLFNYDKQTGRYGSCYAKNIPEEQFAKKLMCADMRRMIYINPMGNVLPCMPYAGMEIENQFPNLLETPLEKILDQGSMYMDYVSQRISDFMEHNEDCRMCEYRSECCGGCRAVAQRDHPGTEFSKDMVVCEFFKGGWKKKTDDLLRRLEQASV